MGRLAKLTGAQKAELRHRAEGATLKELGKAESYDAGLATIYRLAS